MQYYFKEEDLMFYNLLKQLKILPHLEQFLNKHTERIEYAFYKLLTKMKEESRTPRNCAFIEQMDCKNFVDTVNFTFCVIFAKNTVSLSKETEQSKISVLAALTLAAKMNHDPNSTDYIKQLNQVISICTDSIWTSYKA